MTTTIHPLPAFIDDTLSVNLDNLERLAADARWLIKEYRLRLSTGDDMAPWHALAVTHLGGKENDMSDTAEAIETVFRMLAPELAHDRAAPSAGSLQIQVPAA